MKVEHQVNFLFRGGEQRYVSPPFVKVKPPKKDKPLGTTSPVTYAARTAART
jgi:hypothetical protein